MIKSIAISMLMILTAATVNAEVYRCKDGDKTVYTDKPCATGTKIDIRKDNIDEAAAATELAILRRQIHVGMTMDQVKRAWGPPSSINRTLTSRSIREQWVYHPFGEAHGNYVYFVDGIVTTIQN